MPGLSDAPSLGDTWTFYRDALGHKLAARGDAEELGSLSTRLGLAGIASWRFPPPELAVSGGDRGPVRWVCSENGDRLVELARDAEGTDRWTSRFRELNWSALLRRSRPDWRPHVWVHLLATKSDRAVGRLLFLHLDHHREDIDLWYYAPTSWDCFALLDAKDRLVLFTPTRTVDGPPRVLAYDRVHAPSGEYLAKELSEPGGTRPDSFLDEKGARVASFRVADFPARGTEDRVGFKMEIVGSIPPVVPLFGAFSWLVWTMAVQGYRRREDYVARHAINAEKRACPSCGEVPESFFQVRGGWSPAPGEPFVCRCRRVMVLDGHLAPRLPTPREQASWPPAKLEVLQRAGAILDA